MLRRRVRHLVAALVVAAGLLAWPAAVAEAANFLVNDPRDIADANLGDAGCDVDGVLTNGDQCTLRAAIQQANALPGSHGSVLIAGRFTRSISGRDEDAAATGDLDIWGRVAPSTH